MIKLVLKIRPNRHERPSPGEVLISLSGWRTHQHRQFGIESRFAESGHTYEGTPRTPIHTSDGVYDRLFDDEAGQTILIHGGRHEDLDPFRKSREIIRVRFL